MYRVIKRDAFKANARNCYLVSVHLTTPAVHLKTPAVPQASDGMMMINNELEIIWSEATVA